MIKVKKLRLILGVILGLSLALSTGSFATSYPGLTIQQGTENSPHLTNGNGHFVHSETDVVIPGGHGLDLVVSRRYNSGFHQSLNNSYLLISDNSTFGKMYGLKFGHWMGGGWESNLGGILTRAKIRHQEAHKYGWLANPMDHLSDVDNHHYIHVQVNGQNFKFTYDNGWVNASKNSYSNLKEVEGGYELILTNGMTYIFKSKALNQHLRFDYRRNSGNWGWNKEAQRVDDQLEVLFLSEIKNIYGDSIVFTYESPENDELRDMEDIDLKTDFTNFSIGVEFDSENGFDWDQDFDHNDQFDSEGAAIGGTIGAAIGFAIGGPSGAEIGKKIGAFIGSLVMYDKSWGGGFKDTYIYPKRLSSVSDNFGRTIQLTYDKSFQNSDSIDAYISNENIFATKISAVKYEGVNGSTQTIDYTYYTSGEKIGLLNKVTNPDGTTEIYDYKKANELNSEDIQTAHLLDSITSSTGKQTDVLYEWFAGNDNFKQYRITSKSESDANDSTVQKLTWDYTYGDLESFNTYLKDSYGDDTHGYSKLTISGPSGTMIYEYEKGLLTYQTFPSSTDRYIKNEWNADSRLLLTSTTRVGNKFLKYNNSSTSGRRIMFMIRDDTTSVEFQTQYNKYNDYGQPTLISVSGSNMDSYTIEKTYLHESDATIKEKNILHLVTEEKISDGDKTMITSHTFNSGSVVPNTSTVEAKSNTDSRLNKIATTTYSEFSNMNPTKKTLPEGQTIALAYQDSLYPSGVTFENEAIGTSKTFDKKTGLIEKDNGFNSSSTYTYYDDGRIKSVSDEAGTETYSYSGNSVTMVNKIGHYTTKTFDAFGRIKTIERKSAAFEPPYETHTYAYSLSNGQLTKTVASTIKGLTRSSSFVYDSQGRLISQTAPDGSTSTISYGWGNRQQSKTVTDADSKKTTSYYDAYGNLVKVTDANNNSVTYDYDVFGHLTSITDLSGLDTTFTYNALGELIEEVSPYKGTLTYTYDKNGNLTSKTHSSGKKTTFESIDSLGNVGSIVFYDNSNEIGRETHTYHDTASNATNRLFKVNKSNGYSVTYGYDKRGNTTSIEHEFPNGSAYDLSFGYNDLDKLTSISDPKGTTSYAYSTHQRLDTVKRNNAIVADYTYGDGYFGMPSTIDLGNSITIDLDYKNNELSSQVESYEAKVNTNTLYKYNVTAFNSIGNPETLELTQNGQSHTLSYTYDALHRLTNEQLPNAQAYTYSYNKDGSRSSYSTPQRHVSYTRSNGFTTNLSWNETEQTISYDSWGNVTGKTNTIDDVFVDAYSFNYDHHQNLTKATIQSQTNSITYDYQYDHHNHKISTSKNNQLVTMYAWGLLNDPHALLDSLGNTTQTFIYSPDGQKIARETYANGTSLDYYLLDPAGTTVMVLNDAGEQVSSKWSTSFGESTYQNMSFESTSIASSFDFPDLDLNNMTLKKGGTYTSAGKLTLSDLELSSNSDEAADYVFRSGDHINMSPTMGRSGNSSLSTQIFVEDTSEPFSYTQKETQHDLNLMYFGARWYDPQLGQFLSHDSVAPSLESTQALNPYQLSLNNPLMFKDPDGRYIETIFDIGSIGFSGYQLYKNPSWKNLGWLGYDVGSALLPGLVGSAAFRSAGSGVKQLGTVGQATKSAPDWTGTKALSLNLRASGVSRFNRISLIRSFEPGTIVLKRAGKFDYAYRWHGGRAERYGRFFTRNADSTRSTLALAIDNLMTVQSWYRFAENSLYFEGTVAPANGYPGGDNQLFDPVPDDQSSAIYGGGTYNPYTGDDSYNPYRN